MKHSLHDSVDLVMRNLDYYDFFASVEPDENFYASRDTYGNNSYQIECRSTIFQKLSPTMIHPTVLHGEQPIFDFCLLYNFSLWINFIKEHVDYLFPVVLDNLHANRNSFMLKTLMEECESQLKRIEEMNRFYLLDQEENYELFRLKEEFSDFLQHVKMLEDKHRLSFLSIFYHGKNTNCINCQDIKREIYSFL